MKIKVKRTDIFIPKYDGNREDSEPVKVHYRFLTAAERTDFISILPIKIVNGEPEIEMKQDNAGMVRKMVSRIENLSMEIDGKDTIIDDAEKLYKTPGVPATLIQEIENEMATASAEVPSVPLE
jgi:hypothetical protein